MLWWWWCSEARRQTVRQPAKRTVNYNQSHTKCTLNPINCFCNLLFGFANKSHLVQDPHCRQQLAHSTTHWHWALATRLQSLAFGRQSHHNYRWLLGRHVQRNRTARRSTLEALSFQLKSNEQFMAKTTILKTRQRSCYTAANTTLQLRLSLLVSSCVHVCVCHSGQHSLFLLHHFGNRHKCDFKSLGRLNAHRH